ncbi:MAG: PrgI family protein [Oscillospiraceae bacterium]
MPYVNVPNDLSKIKTKLAFNLTKRQLVCFGGGAAIGIPVYLLTRSAIGSTGAMFLMLAVMLPAFLLAMYERDGLPLEKVARNVLNAKLLRPGARPYRTQNIYKQFTETEVQKIAESSTDGCRPKIKSKARPRKGR